jgi:dsRNA-specific ribonuclease
VQGIVSGEGEGATKRDAQRAAAEAALATQGIRVEE